MPKNRTPEGLMALRATQARRANRLPLDLDWADVHADAARAAEAPQLCQWFALCDHEAEWLVPHPILGLVPTCDRCLGRVGDSRRAGAERITK